MPSQAFAKFLLSQAGMWPAATANATCCRMLTFAINNTAFRELVDEFPEDPPSPCTSPRRHEGPPPVDKGV